jgi:hypothetical protein
MGFYIRKGFSFGPLRLNLSRSGLGASFGVKGARIGIGPRGRYIHLGRGGIYYRQSLEPASTNRLPGVRPVDPMPINNDLQEIASRSAVTLSDGSAVELLAELNRVESRVDRFPIVLILGLLMTITSAVVWPGWWWVISVFPVVAGAIYARHVDVLRGTAILRYEWDSDANGPFSQLQVALGQLCACQGLWHVNAAGHTSDWKRNAGAGTLNERSVTRAGSALPPKVQCNISVPVLNAPARKLFFFPDRLLVYDSTGVGAVSYADLQAVAGQTRFVESDIVPRDATQVDTTWRFVNRKGGPDRRFNNNRQLPVMLYGEILLTSSSGLRELFQVSVPAAANGVVSAIAGMATKQLPYRV